MSNQEMSSDIINWHLKKYLGNKVFIPRMKWNIIEKGLVDKKKTQSLTPYKMNPFATSFLLSQSSFRESKSEFVPFDFNQSFSYKSWKIQHC